MNSITEQMTLTKLCVNCKKPLPPGSPKNRKYCDKCKVIVNRRKALEYDKRQREKNAKKKVYADPTSWKPDKADVEYCGVCIYRETNYWNHLCNFYTRTGIRRGCKAGVGCARREIDSSLGGGEKNVNRGNSHLFT